MAEDTKNVKFHEEVQLVALYFLSDFIAPGAHG